MDLESIKELLLSPRPSEEYLAGVAGFLDFAYIGKSSDAKIRCPCVICVNGSLQKREDVYDHLVCSGFSPGYTVWGCHGETASFISANKQGETPTHMRSNKRSRSQFEGTKSNMRQLVEDVFCGPPTIEPETQNTSKPGPDPESQAFYDLLRDADQPLWPGCELSILSLVVSEKGIKKDKYGYTLVNFSHLMHKGDKIEHEPFILPNQADQVFYLEDELNPGWSVVMQNNLRRDRCDTGNDECTRDVEAEPFHVSHLTDMFKKKRKDQHWVRSDIEGTIVDANDNALMDEE